jgi:hypothetical protein
VIFTLDPHWKRSREVSDSFRLLLALASPAGVQKIPELIDKARLQQARVTKELREQARQAIGRFIQEVLDHSDNQPWLAEQKDRAALARALWHEGLVIVYRLLFVLKLESSDDPARSFTFASTSLWRNTFSPSMALASYAPKVLYEGIDTGGLLEQGLRGLFRMFHEGVECTELNVKSLGGALFSADATPVLSQLRWGERAVAHLLDQLLWTTPKKKGRSRERVHYGPLDVEDLGRVYEALLELEPGIATEPMCRLRRQKLEVVVPIAQGEKYRLPLSAGGRVAGGEGGLDADDADDVDEPEEDEDGEDDSPKRGKKTTVLWIEEIQPGKFYLRVGLGRKATGSYYTPHSFVRFLVQETLGPQVAERSPQEDPQPGEILKLKVLDPAMGSGHFLVEACRFLGQHIYEALRLCDEKATAAERRAEQAKRKEDREVALAEAQKYRQRVIDLPDPDDELLRYLPSRSVEGDQAGVSQRRAEALCRRMVAVHCLYGVDKNPLAVELAKLALWLESHAEGMPLTFLDHRFVVGDSLTGQFWEQMLSWPSKPKEKFKEGMYKHIETQLRSALFDALRHVRRLEATVGVSLAEVNDKTQAKADLDEALLPFRVAAAAWCGGVMLGPEHCDDAAYVELLEHISATHELPDLIQSEVLCRMIASGLGVAPPSPAYERGAEGESGLLSSDLRSLLSSGRCTPTLSYDLSFPEVFYPTGIPYSRHGFDAVLGNPPWEQFDVAEEEYWCRFDLAVLSVSDKHSRKPLIDAVAAGCPSALEGWNQLLVSQEEYARILDSLYKWQSADVGDRTTTGRPDLYRLFCERGTQLIGKSAYLGWVLPSAFHANEGATGVRQLYLRHLAIKCCYSFENRRKLFEIDSRFKFAIIVAISGAATSRFSCAFYLHDDEWLFGDKASRQVLWYTNDFVNRSGGVYCSFAECRTQIDADLLDAAHSSHTVSAGEFCNASWIAFAFGVELHRNRDFDNRFEPPLFGDDIPFRNRLEQDSPVFVLEGKCFNQFTDRGEYAVRVQAPVSVATQKAKWNPGIAFYRLAYRAVASSTNERSLICTVLPPGVICNHSIAIEVSPQKRPTDLVIRVAGILNTYFLDWQVRQKTGANISAFIFQSLRMLDAPQSRGFVTHQSLRLICNHSGYAPLWREQVGEVWREKGKPPMTWPILAGDDERWAVRAAIDALVVDAYGLSRDQYAHVLSTFSHASYPKAPELCLARFDELKKLGFDKFTRKYDPYWDIPLNENLPQPVIDLPIPGEAKGGADGEFRLTGASKPAKRAPKKK